MFGVSSIDDAKFLEEQGFKDFVIGYNPMLMRQLSEVGYNVHIVLGTFKIGNRFKNIKYLAEDPFGRKHIWFGSGCPNNPEIQRYTLNKIEDIVSNYDVKSIILDGIRFASLGSGLEAFSTCFCEHCKRKAEELGFSYEEMKNSVKDLLFNFYDIRKMKNDLDAYNYTPLGFLDFAEKTPSLVEWIRFRERSIMDYIKEIRNLILSKGTNVKLGAYIFTPSLAILVGQNYSEIWKYLDFIKPMIYRIGMGVACLNYEFSVIAEDIKRWNIWLSEEEILRNIYRFFGFEKNEEYPLSIEDLRKNGLPLSAIEKEFIMAKKILSGKKELHPIVMLHDKNIDEVVKIAMDTGIDGIDFFTYRKELKSNVLKISEVIK